MRVPTFIAISLSLWPILLPAAGDKPSPIRWKKTVIDRRFLAEGVTVADVNKDGKNDILHGELWYEAPDWKPHRIRPGKDDYRDGEKNVYSKCFACWIDDLNQDGWPDLISIGFPGAPFHWYENPQGKDGFWKEHVIGKSACNETPQYVDLFGTGKRVIVLAIQPEGQMVWFEPGSDPTQPWTIHPISESSTKEKRVPGTNQYAHGLGIGDVNGDGRLDVIVTGGWWEQPAKLVPRTPWKFHPAALGPDCADMFAYDVDGDGTNDILSSSAHGLGIWWHKQLPSEAGSTFQRRDLFKDLFSQSHALHFTDINGDGLKDLVTGKRFWAHGPKGDVNPGDPAVLYWFEARKGKDGLTEFVPHLIDDDSGIGTQFWVGDVNGDRLPDIVIANKKGVFLFEQMRP